MIMRKAVLSALAVVFVAGVSGCGERKEIAAVEAAGDNSPVLDAGAAEAALAMIKQDLNVPLAELQTLLAAAAEDGDIRAQELMLYADEGAVPLDWWVWNKGLVHLAVEPGYGPYIGLARERHPIPWLRRDRMADACVGRIAAHAMSSSRERNQCRLQC